MNATRNVAYTRPNFPSAEAWAAHATYWLSRGREPWEPRTADELRLAAQRFPDRLTGWLPSPDWCEWLGLGRWFGRRAVPFAESWQERFLTTLHTDPQFRAAVKNLLEAAT